MRPTHEPGHLRSGKRFYLPTKSKYIKGNNPCGNCAKHKHKTCRPRMDGTLCTCSCERADQIRTDIELHQRSFELKGEPIPTVTESLKAFDEWGRYKTPFAT